MFFDPLYIIMLLPALILSVIASALVKTTFSKYSGVPSGSGLTGAEAARRMLSHSGVQGVKIERVDGFLSDHYDPVSKTLRLSPGVYGSDSLAAVGVACHEAGHAVQHARGYFPLKIRTALVPVTQFGSTFSYWIILLGLLMSGTEFGVFLVKLGVILFAAAVLFSFVTLPVEWDASARAKREMQLCGIVNGSNADGASSVLNAAFLTYVAAAASALMTLLYYLVRLGLLGGRDRD